MTAKQIDTMEKALDQASACWRRVYWQMRKTAAWKAYWRRVQQFEAAQKAAAEPIEE